MTSDSDLSLFFRREMERLQAVHPLRSEEEIASVLREVWILLRPIQDRRARLTTAGLLARQRLSTPARYRERAADY